MNDMLEGKKHYTRKINVKAKGNFPKNLWGLWGSEWKKNGGCIFLNLSLSVNIALRSINLYLYSKKAVNCINVSTEIPTT